MNKDETDTIQSVKQPKRCLQSLISCAFLFWNLFMPHELDRRKVYIGERYRT